MLQHCDQGRNIDSAGLRRWALFCDLVLCQLSLKVHKHEIIQNFFLTKIKSLYSLGKFSKKISLLFLQFPPEIRSLNIFAVTEHTRNQIFLERYPKNFFVQNVQLGPIRWVPKRFFKIWILYSRNLHFNVGFLNDFRKLQQAYAEHTRKRFYRTLSILGNDFIAH